MNCFSEIFHELFALKNLEKLNNWLMLFRNPTSECGEQLWRPGFFNISSGHLDFNQRISNGLKDRMRASVWPRESCLKIYWKEKISKKT